MNLCDQCKNDLANVAVLRLIHSVDRMCNQEREDIATDPVIAHRLMHEIPQKEVVEIVLSIFAVRQCLEEVREFIPKEAGVTS